jgi:hypothetical protein
MKSAKFMKIFERISNLDRRIIFLAIALAVVIPLLFPLHLNVDISAPVKGLYRTIDSLPAGSVILISTDYDPATYPELYPATEAILRHAFSRNLKVYMMAMWPQGVQLGTKALAIVAPEYNKQYGVDYVNGGYRPGGAVMLITLGKNFRDVFVSDFRGAPADSFPLMRQVRSAQDITMIVSLSAGDPGILAWILYYRARYHTMVGAATTAIMAPQMYPYLQSNQLVGLMGGLKGAAEYEKLIKKPRLATAGMDSQSITHSVIVFFILLGNVMYFLTRKRK